MIYYKERSITNPTPQLEDEGAAMDDQKKSKPDEKRGKGEKRQITAIVFYLSN